MKPFLILIIALVSFEVFSLSGNIKRKSSGGSSIESCFVRATNAGRVIGTSQTTYVFDTEIDDECSAYNPSTGVFTAPYDGKYSVSGDAGSANVTFAATNYFVCVVNVGGSGVFNGTKSFGDGDGGTKSHISNWSGVVKLSQGENVTIQCVSGISNTASARLFISRVGI